MSEAERLIRERADSFASDARRFADAGRIGQPIITPAEDAYWARLYRTVADELRRVAVSLPVREPEPDRDLEIMRAALARSR